MSKPVALHMHPVDAHCSIVMNRFLSRLFGGFLLLSVVGGMVEAVFVRQSLWYFDCLVECPPASVFFIGRGGR